MSKSMDPFSGSYSMTSGVRIPSWEKGSKKVPHWDSSDLSGISSSSSSSGEDDSSFDASFTRDESSYVVDSEDDEAGSAQMASLGVGLDGDEEQQLKDDRQSTPRAATAKKHFRRDSTASKSGGSATYKGKGKAKNQDEEAAEDGQHVSPTAAAAASSTARQSLKSRPRRPRSHSNASNNVSSPPFLSSLSHPNAITASAESSSSSSSYCILSKRAPGPAAQAMADFMSNPSSNNDSGNASTRRLSHNAVKPSFSSNSQGLMPASALQPSSSKLGSRPLSRPAHLVQSNRQLGRATSAPVNLFGESLPTNNLFSPGRSSLSKMDEEGGADLLCPASPSPEADLHSIIDKAYESRSGSIDLSRKNLVRLPTNVSDLSHFVTLDVRTNKSHPTPIDLYLDSNFLNASGLPSSLFSITNLRILSLRGNQIESLSQSIGNLKALKQLLLFNNKLTYLPAEILELKLEKLQLGSNRFPAYEKPIKVENKPENKGDADNTEEEIKLNTSLKRVCEPRKKNFQVPTLLELCTRRLLEPIDGSRESGNSPVISKSKLFTPGMSNTSTGNVRRHFHSIKDKIISPRTDYLPVPPHLLKPFLPLLNPLPHHLRCLLSPARSPALSNENAILDTPSSRTPSTTRTPGTPSSSIQTPFEAVKDLPQCSVCKTACSEFAETRVEWRSEIAGVQLGKGDDERCWVPVLWRGCSANCLDFLDEE